MTVMMMMAGVPPGGGRGRRRLRCRAKVPGWRGAHTAGLQPGSSRRAAAVRSALEPPRPWPCPAAQPPPPPPPPPPSASPPPPPSSALHQRATGDSRDGLPPRPSVSLCGLQVWLGPRFGVASCAHACIAGCICSSSGKTQRMHRRQRYAKCKQPGTG
jgi:hypothetical protein